MQRVIFFHPQLRATRLVVYNKLINVTLTDRSADASNIDFAECRFNAFTIFKRYNALRKKSGNPKKTHIYAENRVLYTKLSLERQFNVIW